MAAWPYLVLLPSLALIILSCFQVVATDNDLAEPYNVVIYDTAGTPRAEQYFDVDVTTGDIFVKRDLRFPTSQTSEVFLLDIQVCATKSFLSLHYILNGIGAN